MVKIFSKTLADLVRVALFKAAQLTGFIEWHILNNADDADADADVMSTLAQVLNRCMASAQRPSSPMNAGAQL